MVDFALLNELSLPFPCQQKVDKGFEIFFHILKLLKQRDIQKIRVEKDIKSLEIIQEVYFPQYFGQVQNKELKDRLRTFITNNILVIESPLIKNDEDEQEHLLENEYFFNGNSTNGALACCDIWDSVVISFSSNHAWDSSFIEIEKENIDSSKQKLHIRNISQKIHFEDHEEFFQKFREWIKSSVTRDNLFSKKEELFKNRIILCDEVKKQIKRIDIKIFSQALGILVDLENGRSLHEYRISKESSSVAQDESLKSLRMFKVDTEMEYFENHIKSLSNGYRIHYFEKDDKIYIGYIGKHLPTKKFG